ncbi:MAG: dTDP-4-dehydrorhamnose 3,5-epimerase [Calditrichaeota bacterium]|nr:MAG: dTDP-4-dehydrorhamnose 3,5-epimerase [Calditrichota bacterium]
MKVIPTRLQGVMIVEPAVYRDERGFFLETFHGQKYAAEGLPERFVQDNHSHSKQGVLRGLHYQLKQPQGKLIYVVQGEIFDVAVDIRKESPDFGKWVGVILSSENKRQLYIPPGYAHGFYVLSETADVIYKCTDFYAPKDEYGLLWSDPQIGIDWPIQKGPLLSEKDRHYPTLATIRRELLP